MNTVCTLNIEGILHIFDWIIAIYVIAVPNSAIKMQFMPIHSRSVHQKAWMWWAIRYYIIFITINLHIHHHSFNKYGFEMHYAILVL